MRGGKYSIINPLRCDTVLLGGQVLTFRVIFCLRHQGRKLPVYGSRRLERWQIRTKLYDLAYQKTMLKIRLDGES